MEFVTFENIKREYGTDLEVKNACIEDLYIEIIGHFNNAVNLVMICKYNQGLRIQPWSLYNSTANVGYIIRALVELLDASREDGIKLHELKNSPIRLVTDEIKVVAIGNYLFDKFIPIYNLMNVMK